MFCWSFGDFCFVEFLWVLFVFLWVLLVFLWVLFDFCEFCLFFWSFVCFVKFLLSFVFLFTYFPNTEPLLRHNLPFPSCALAASGPPEFVCSSLKLLLLLLLTLLATAAAVAASSSTWDRLLLLLLLAGFHQKRSFRRLTGELADQEFGNTHLSRFFCRVFFLVNILWRILCFLSFLFFLLGFSSLDAENRVWGLMYSVAVSAGF